MNKVKLSLAALPVAAAMTLSIGTSQFADAASKTAPPQYQPMVIACDDGSPTMLDNFNPFSPNVDNGSAWIYETLFYTNSQNGKQTPWLATSYKWSGPLKLTFTMRSGVKWSDGQPFSAKDVAYTFNMLKLYPALDSNGLWPTLKSVTAVGNQVIFVFNQPDVPALTFINDTPIVPEHIWSKVKNPVTYPDTDPIGTGAFVLASFNPNQYVLKRNPGYWQASKIHESELIFPALNGAQTVDMNLSLGKYTWAQAFVPNVQQTYIARDPAYRKYWFAPAGASNLELNLTKYPLNQLAFRQALEYAISKPTLSSKGEYTYDPVASPTGLRIPGQNQWLQSSLLNQYPYHYDPSKAAQLLAVMGLKKNAQGLLLGKNGQPIALTLDVPTGWTDWIEDCQIIQQELGALGITVHVQTPDVATWYNDLQMGTYDMSITTGINQYDPWFYYDLNLNSAYGAPIGKPASSNFERWNNAQTDKLLNKYKSLSSLPQREAIIHQLEKIMMAQVPVIPLFYNANWNEYSTKVFVGWPDAANPYATPSFSFPDEEMIMTHLTLR